MILMVNPTGQSAKTSPKRDHSLINLQRLKISRFLVQRYLQKNEQL